jgi:hypothetical protein
MARANPAAWWNAPAWCWERRPCGGTIDEWGLCPGQFERQTWGNTMSHHASNDSEFPGGANENRRGLDELMNRLAGGRGAGATGQFPRGQIHRTDEGELRLAVTVINNTVVLAFGKPVSWVGFSRVEAIELAELIKRRAQEL